MNNEQRLADYEAHVLNMVHEALGQAPLPAPPPPGVCPECLQLRLDDDRVANGMRRAECAYGVPTGGLTG